MKKLFKLAMLAALAMGVMKLMEEKRNWQGLTETELRLKLDGRLSGKVDDPDKRAEIADKVVGAMRDRGMLRDDVAVAGDGSPEHRTS